MVRKRSMVDTCVYLYIENYVFEMRPTPMKNSPNVLSSENHTWVLRILEHLIPSEIGCNFLGLLTTLIRRGIILQRLFGSDLTLGCVLKISYLEYIILGKMSKILDFAYNFVLRPKITHSESPFLKGLVWYMIIYYILPVALRHHFTGPLVNFWGYGEKIIDGIPLCIFINR